MDLVRFGNILVSTRLVIKLWRTFAVCFVCKQEWKYSGGTTNLSQHIEKHHSELYQSSASTSGSKSIQSQITSLMKQPVVKLKTFTQSMFTESITEYICEDLVPLSTVDSKHFKGMVKMVSGGTYECPSRKYFTETLLPKMWDDCTEMIKNWINYRFLDKFSYWKFHYIHSSLHN